jgi:alpha-glucoside transport system substrate-binding protein
VESALEVFAGLLSPTTIAGGVDSALSTTFEASVRNVTGQPPRAAMVFEGDFVAGLLRDAETALGTDIDVFPFPGTGAAAPGVIGAGDAAVMLRRSAAANELLQFFAGPRAARVWATEGGFVSPNLNLDLAVYPDPITRGIARRIVEAGDNFRFDLSDDVPAAFGAVEGQGIRAALQEFLTTRNVAATAARLEAEAAGAYAR